MKTFKILSAAALSAALVPLAASAADVTESEMQAVRTALASVSCVVSDSSTASMVENNTGYDTEKLELVVEALRATGEVIDINDGQGIRLTSGVCAN